MNRQIVAVRMSNGTELKHIAGCVCVSVVALAWNSEAFPVANVIAEIEAGTCAYFTRDWRGETAAVTVVRNADGSKYLRTKPDATQADNLLRLPRYAE